jgi:hypothetical protein
MPALKKRLNKMRGSFAAAKGRGRGGGDVSTGEFQGPANKKTAARGMVMRPGGRGQGGPVSMMQRQLAAAKGSGQPQPPLTTAGAAIPEVAAADTQRAAAPAEPVAAPIPGGGPAEMGPTPRGVQDAGAGGGGQLTAGGPVGGTGQPAAPLDLRQRFLNRGGPRAAIEQPAVAGAAAPVAGAAAPMMAQYMANRGRMNPAQRQKRKSRFYTGV